MTVFSWETFAPIVVAVQTSTAEFDLVTFLVEFTNFVIIVFQNETQIVRNSF